MSFQKSTKVDLKHEEDYSKQQGWQKWENLFGIPFLWQAILSQAKNLKTIFL